MSVRNNDLLFLTSLAGHSESFWVFSKSCYLLQEITFSFHAYIGRVLDSIPSSSVALIHLHEPQGLIKIRSYRDKHIISEEWGRLGISIRNVAQMFSNNRRGLKMRVRVIHQVRAPWIDDPQEKSEEVSFYVTKLEEGLEYCVTLELNTLPYPPGPWHAE